jgi:hypothetical protein
VSKLIVRIGLIGFVIAVILFALPRLLGPSTAIEHLQSLLWPTSMLLGPGALGAGALGAEELAAMAFSALLNGACYLGLAWLVWWAARLAGWISSAPSEKDRFVSLFLAVGVSFSLLVALAEALIHGFSKLGANGLLVTWLIAANLFALVVVTCASSAWMLWWLRGFYQRHGRGGSRSPGSTPGSPARR